MKRWVLRFAVLGFLVIFVDQARADLAMFTTAGTGDLRNNYTGTVGAIFEVGSQAITVTALGVFEAGTSLSSHSVAIWEEGPTVSTPVLIASATVPAVTSGTAGSFVYTSITPVVLNANSYYSLIADYTSGGDKFRDFNNGGSGYTEPAFNSSIKMMGRSFGISGAATHAPSTNQIAPGDGPYVGPNLEIQSAVATPEPNTLLVAGCGIIGFAGYAWRKRRQNKAA